MLVLIPSEALNSNSRQRNRTGTGNYDSSGHLSVLVQVKRMGVSPFHGLLIHKTF